MNTSMTARSVGRLAGFMSLFALLFALPAVQAEIDTALFNPDHHRDYQEALDKVAEGQSRISDEMLRIRLGKVAHYDFLQYEHIQLLRHARALNHPPADLPQAKREHIQGHALELVGMATELELVIADFLRAQSQISGAVSNTRDIVAQLGKEAGTDLRGRLEALDVAVQAAATATQAADELKRAYAAVLDMPIADQYRKELAAQQNMLLGNIGIPESQMEKIKASGIQELATKLKAYYQS